MAITASEARARPFQLIEQVNNVGLHVEIISKKGNAVLMSMADYESLEETACLLRTPAHAAHLLEGIAQHKAGQLHVHELSE